MSDPLRVLWQSDDVLVADKPATIATEPDRERGVSLRDLVDAALARSGMRERAHAASRLDRGVSGCVTFLISARAKRDPARWAPQRKCYVALAVAAAAPLPQTIWRAPIEGREAETRAREIARREAGRSAVGLLALEPITGRTHQLRLHASQAGLPLLGDRRYGGPSSLATASGRVIALARPALHAAAVDLPGGVHLEAPIPEDLAAWWSALDGDAEAWKEAIAP